MIIWGVAVWWYTNGWHQCLRQFVERIEATIDFFSFDLLLSTLFAPFRQISAGRVGGPFEVQLQAFFDRLISRCIGAIVRIFMIIIGGMVILSQLVFGLIILVGWAFVPLLPILGMALFITGWLPWNN